MTDLELGGPGNGCPSCGRDIDRLGGNPDCPVCAAEPMACWLNLNGWGDAGYMDGGPEQDRECKTLRGDAVCAVHSDLGNWTPETLVARIATGKCAIVGEWCLTHDAVADFGHYLDTRPVEDHGHDPVSGIAYDD